MVVWEVHQALRESVKPGVTTAELNEEALRMCKAAGAEPAFLGYPSGKRSVPAFPGVLCTSVNEEIVHGIPNERPLREGDILSIDFGCCLEGYFGDAAVTHAIGQISDEATELLRITEESLELAIQQCVPGKRIGDISHAVQNCVEKKGFGVVREFVGHGIGENMHEPPHVPNFGKAGRGFSLKPGMVLAIEPMITAGDFAVKMLSDGWTAVTSDGSLSAHFEHSVAITDSEPYVLSRP
ncbi:UNVERIFIED_CONTAM: hypothetical protein GTU68_016359 [Idotea baltica]|nr:hypothetical protein [Idotea baltica]